MKRLHLICLLLSLVLITQLNAQETTKRPSWSQGLPERTTTLKPTVDRDTESDAAETDRERPRFDAVEINPQPEVEVELSTEPLIQPELVIPETTVIPTQNNRKAALQAYFDGTEEGANTATENEQAAADYNWRVIRTEPIAWTGQNSAPESLKLYIHINPDGQVIKVTKADTSISKQVMQQAERSILQWQFEPPKAVGVAENISKEFTIEIQGAP